MVLDVESEREEDVIPDVHVGLRVIGRIDGHNISLDDRLSTLHGG